MNELPEPTDLQKLYDAVQCVRKTLRCSVCLKPPTEANAGKCGHPFCKTCGDKLLCSKRAVCSICKAGIVRSAVYSVQSINKIVKDLESLCAAIEKDSDAIIRLDKPKEVRQYQDRWKGLTFPGPSSDKIEQESSLKSDLSRGELPPQNKGKRSQAKEAARQESIDSRETIKIQNRKARNKSEAPTITTPSISKTTNIISEPVFTADNLPIKIGAIGYMEKVEDWLNKEEFKDKEESNLDISEPSGSKSPAISEILESYSQVKQNSIESTRSRRTSRASKTPSKNEPHQRSLSPLDTGRKFKSFTFEATDKAKNNIPKTVTTAEEMFEDLKRKTLKEPSNNKKSKVLPISADNSWSELARLKKEARPKVRKRSRLNVSLERPSSAKPVIDPLNCEDFEDEEGLRDSSLEGGKNKSERSNKGTFTEDGSAKKRQKPALVSQRILEPDEMFDVSKLNRSQVKDIIGVQDDSKNSSNSPDKSPIKSNRNKLSLRRSNNNATAVDPVSHFEENSRPGSKQSFHADSRPSSRLSYKSSAKPSAEKFRLSTGRRSTTPNVGLLEVTADINKTQQREQDQEEESLLNSNSPVRTCNIHTKNKLSLKRQSSGSSKATDRDSKISANVPITKLGKLHKIRNRIKFIFLGSTRSRPKTKESIIATCEAMTQTDFRPSNTVLTSNNSHRKHFSSESMGCTIIPETRTVSDASTDSKQIKGAQGLDTVNKVNMLSPEEDSQLKFLATKSPLVPRMSSIYSDDKVRSFGKSHKAVKESSFTNVSRGTSGLEDFSLAVKKCAEDLIVTDSEDQDTPNERFTRIKLHNNREVQKKESDKAISSGTTSFASKTTPGPSNLGTDVKIEAVTNSSITSIDKSLSQKSVKNNSGRNSSQSSSRRKRWARDLLGSQTKKRDIEKSKSLARTEGSYLEQALDSDASTALLEKTKIKDVEQRLEDSEASAITAKHKVVRKLKYSEESGSNANTGSGRSESLAQQVVTDKKKSDHAPKKKTFQRIRRISSTDSDELLRISLTTKQSSNNSQIIQKPGPSREITKSPIPSEDMTVVFSSNKDTQESKRKRSPSPNSLNNHDLQAIALNWCADLDRSSEEILLDDNEVLGLAKDISSDIVPHKKPRVEIQGSSASTSIDNFSAAIYEKRRNCNEVQKKIEETNDKLLSNEEPELIDNLDKVAAQFDAADAEIHSAKGKENSFSRGISNPANNTSHIDLAGNVECSIKQGNAMNRTIESTRNVVPIKTESLEHGDLSLVHGHSQTSDKENEPGSQGVKKKVEPKQVLSNATHTAFSDEDFRDLEVTFPSQKSEANDTPKSNSKDVPGKTNPTNCTKPFESSFDRDCLDITQEQILMQEVEDNLLGRKSKNVIETKRQKNLASKSPNKNTKTSSPGKEPATTNSVDQKIKAYQIAQIDTDDSEMMDEDIIESTPEKNVPSRKDTQVENSQRFILSPKSFMSQDMTPISKTISKHSRTKLEVSGLSQPILQPLSSNHNLSESVKAEPPSHSTPKSTISLSRKSNLQKESDNLISTQNRNRNRNRRLCFVCSYLTLPEVQLVKAFARKHNVEYTATYKPEVTHVIVQTNDRDSAGRTLKYLLGVAHKKWIVSFRWVTDSMKQNKILDETSYEAVDSDTEEPGPQRSRLSTKGLFEGFAFVLMKPFSDITVDQLEDLISSTGGTVVETLDNLASIENKHKLILYNGEIHESAVLENWRKRSDALPVQVDWVLSCISQYELVSLRCYLGALEIQLLPSMGLPAKLTAEEEEDSYSADEASTPSNTP